MTTLLAQSCENVFRQCLEAEHGIEITVIGDEGATTPSLRARQILYRFRKELNNPEFLDISIRLSKTDPDRKLWLINKGKSNG